MTQRTTAIEILIGIGALFLCHVIFIVSLYSLYVLGFAASSLSLDWLAYMLGTPLLFIGFFQILYALPLGQWFKAKRRFNAMKGVIAGVLVTILFNGWYFLYFVENFDS